MEKTIVSCFQDGTHLGDDMKNWLIFITVFIISLSLVLSVIILWKADAPFNEVEAQAEQLSVDDKLLALVTESYSYNSNQSYVTVFGVDEYGEEKAVFIPTSLEKDGIKEVFLKDGISREQALSVLENERKVKEVLHVKLGYEESGAVWEVTYLSDTGKLNYVYILFKDGQWWKRILNL